MIITNNSKVKLYYSTKSYLLREIDRDHYGRYWVRIESAEDSDRRKVPLHHLFPK